MASPDKSNRFNIWNRFNWLKKARDKIQKKSIQMREAEYSDTESSESELSDSVTEDEQKVSKKAPLIDLDKLLTETLKDMQWPRFEVKDVLIVQKEIGEGDTPTLEDIFSNIGRRMKGEERALKEQMLKYEEDIFDQIMHDLHDYKEATSGLGKKKPSKEELETLKNKSNNSLQHFQVYLSYKIAYEKSAPKNRVAKLKLLYEVQNNVLEKVHATYSGDIAAKYKIDNKEKKVEELVDELLLHSFVKPSDPIQDIYKICKQLDYRATKMEDLGKDIEEVRKEVKDLTLKTTTVVERIKVKKKASSRKIKGAVEREEDIYIQKYLRCLITGTILNVLI